MQIGQLQPGTYLFQVQVRVNGAKESVDGPSVNFDAMDITPPLYFEASAQLRAEQISPTSLRLKWDTAYDDIEVMKYRIYQETELIGESEASGDDQFLVEGLDEGRSYLFQVEAEDTASNVSIHRLVTAISQSD